MTISRGNFTTQGGAASTSVTFALPSGAIAGDLAVATWSYRLSTTTISATPSGWTNIERRQGNINAVTSYKVLTAADITAGSFQWTISDSVKSAGSMRSYSSTNGWDAAPKTSTEGTNSAATGTTGLSSGTTATTTAPSGAEIVLCGNNSCDTNATWGAHSDSFVEFSEVSSTGGAGSTRNTTSSSDRIVSSNSTYSYTATLSASNNWAAIVVGFEEKAASQTGAHSPGTGQSLSASASGVFAGAQQPGAGAGHSASALGLYAPSLPQGQGSSDAFSAVFARSVSADFSAGAGSHAQSSLVTGGQHQAGAGVSLAAAGTVGTLLSLRVSWVLLDLDSSEAFSHAASAGLSGAFSAYRAADAFHDASIGAAVQSDLAAVYSGDMPAGVGLFYAGDGDTDKTGAHAPGAGASFGATGQAEQWTYETHSAGASQEADGYVVSWEYLSEPVGASAQADAQLGSLAWSYDGIGAALEAASLAVFDARQQKDSGIGFLADASSVLHAAVVEAVGAGFVSDTGAWIADYAEFSLGSSASAHSTYVGSGQHAAGHGASCYLGADAVLSAQWSSDLGARDETSGRAAYPAYFAFGAGLGFQPGTETGSIVSADFGVGASGQHQSYAVLGGSLAESQGASLYVYSYTVSQRGSAQASGLGADAQASRVTFGQSAHDTGAGFSAEYTFDAVTPSLHGLGAAASLVALAVMLQQSAHRQGLSQLGAGATSSPGQQQPSGGLGILVEASLVRRAEALFGLGASDSGRAEGIYVGDLIQAVGASCDYYAGGGVFLGQLRSDLGLRGEGDEFEEELNRVLVVGADGRVLAVGADDRLLGVGREDRELPSGGEDRLLVVGSDDRALVIGTEGR